MFETIKNFFGIFPPKSTKKNQPEQRSTDKVYGNNNYYETFGIQENVTPSEKEQKDLFVSIFFRCITMRANLMSTGMMKFMVARLTGQNESEEVEDNHPWVRLLQKPNPFMPTRQFYNWISENYDLEGHADIIIQRNGMGVPIAMLPVFKEFGEIYPVPGEFGNTEGWVFFRHDGQRFSFVAEDVIRIGRTRSTSPWETISLLQTAMSDIESEQSMKKWRKNATEHGGITSQIITTDQSISKDQADQYSQRVKQFMGSKGAGKVLTLGSGLQPMTQSSKDLEAIEGIAQTKDDIKEICGVPVGMFQQDANRASAESIRYQFIENTINPELKNIAAALEYGLLRAFRAQGLIINIPDLRPLDEDQEIKWRNHMIQTGQRNVNEYRAQDGLEELEHGETYWISPGLVPVDQAMKDPLEGLGGEGDNDGSGEGEGSNDDNNRSTRAHTGYSEDELFRIWRSVDRKKTYQKGVVRSQTLSLFEKWREFMIKKVDESDPNRDIMKRNISEDIIIDLNELTQMLEEDMRPATLQTIRLGFQVGASRLDLNLSFSEIEVKTVVEDIMHKTKSVPETLKKELGLQIQDAVREQADTEDIKGIIQDYFDDTMKNRSWTVAQTVTTSGFEAGQTQSFSKAGMQAKAWLSQRDGKVRDTHRRADGQTVGINDTFRVGGRDLQFPGDPSGEASEVINCRCTQLPKRKFG